MHCKICCHPSPQTIAKHSPLPIDLCQGDDLFDAYDNDLVMKFLIPSPLIPHFLLSFLVMINIKVIVMQKTAIMLKIKYK